ncbi:MAG: hypothetical protein RIE31_08610 [Alphaproteobacteria bacterium]
MSERAQRSRWGRVLGAMAAALLLAVAGPGPLAVHHALAEEAFVAGFEDLPLMAGLTLAEDGGVRFATNGGRIVEAWATGRTSAAAVVSFYGDTLPQLGWRALADVQPGQPAVFAREGERLTIAVTPAGDSVTVSFFLRPAGR